MYMYLHVTGHISKFLFRYKNIPYFFYKILRFLIRRLSTQKPSRCHENFRNTVCAKEQRWELSDVAIRGCILKFVSIHKFKDFNYVFHSKAINRETAHSCNLACHYCWKMATSLISETAKSQIDRTQGTFTPNPVRHGMALHCGLAKCDWRKSTVVVTLTSEHFAPFARTAESCPVICLSAGCNGN